MPSRRGSGGIDGKSADDTLHLHEARALDEHGDIGREGILDLGVQIHEARLGRVITNLLDNALSFSPEGGTITVSARRIGREIAVAVDDEGPGIPEDRLETIFERFYSDRPQSDTTLGKNSGLGLSISRDIVDAYGGCIEAVNRTCPAGTFQAQDDHPALRARRAPGVAGTRFTVRLPAADADAPRGAQQLARRI